MSVPSFEPDVWPGRVTGRPALRLISGGRAVDPVAARRRGVRLTRRGRAVLLGLLAVLLTAAVVGPTVARSAVATTGSAPATERVVVAPGDTLWSIAAAVAPDADRRTAVDAIIAANHLDGAHIEPGQQLVVPVLPAPPPSRP